MRRKNVLGTYSFIDLGKFLAEKNKTVGRS